MNMTIQQAIRVLNLPGDHIKDYEEYGFGIDDELKEAILIAKAALRKRQPTMVTHNATIQSCCTCPSCSNVVDEFTEFVPGQKIRVQAQWCKYCGQALKWEDE